MLSGKEKVLLTILNVVHMYAVEKYSTITSGWKTENIHVITIRSLPILCTDLAG